MIGARWNALANTLQPFVFEAGDALAELAELGVYEAETAVAVVEAFARCVQRHDEAALHRMAAAAVGGPVDAPARPTQRRRRYRRGLRLR
jgi:hypothetical protein